MSKSGKSSLVSRSGTANILIVQFSRLSSAKKFVRKTCQPLFS